MARPFISHQFQNLLHLLHMQALANVNDVNRLVQFVFLKLHDGKGKFFGGIQRGAVRTQDNCHSIFFFCTQDCVNVDDNRIFGSSISRYTACYQLVYEDLARIFCIAFK